MKKALKIFAVLFMTAVFIYGAYSYYYEFIRWSNLTLVYLNAVLVCLPIGICSAISQSLSRKNSKMQIALAFVGGAVAGVAALFGIGFLVNNVIYEAKEKQKAISIVFTIMVALFTAVLLSLYIRLFKNSKVLKAVVSVVLVVAMLSTNIALVFNYIDWSFIYPLYRLSVGLGGVDSEVESIKYTFARSTDKIQPSAKMNEMADIDIALAKNEWENFQLIVASNEKGQAVTLEVTDFINEKGDVLPVDIYKENYSECQYPAGTVDRMYPDALVPINGTEQIELAKSSTQAFFIETRSSADSPAGEYTATLTLKNADGDVALNKEIKATVWNFVLPEGHYSDTAMGIFGANFFELAAQLPSNLWGHNGGGYNEISADQETVYKKYYDYLLDHGISAYNLPYDVLDDRADAYMSDPRVKSFIIPYYEDDEVLAKAYAKVTSNPVWAEKAYFYPIDEPHTQEHFDNYNAVIERLERVCPGFNMVTPFNSLDVPEDSTINPYELQRDNNSILCPISECHDNESFRNDMATLTSMGKHSWWYVCCGPSDESGMCNMFIFQNAIKHRMLFWQQYDYDVTGLLYWNTVYWDKCGNPWESAKTWDTWESAGDGMWLYPGAQVGVDGPVGSLRLKNVTAGLEDYDYLRMAQEKFGKEWVDQTVARVTQSLTEYTSDAELFEKVRREVGEKLAA